MAGKEDSPYFEEKNTDHRFVEVRTSGKDSTQGSNDISFKKFINVAVLIFLLALVFIALFSFFFNMQEAIIAIFNPKYQALVQALFSLLILIVGIYTIRLLLPNKH